jgi:hypothetical protein
MTNSFTLYLDKAVLLKMKRFELWVICNRFGLPRMRSIEACASIIVNHCSKIQSFRKKRELFFSSFPCPFLSLPYVQQFYVSCAFDLAKSNWIDSFSLPDTFISVEALGYLGDDDYGIALGLFASLEQKLEYFKMGNQFFLSAIKGFNDV